VVGAALCWTVLSFVTMRPLQVFKHLLYGLRQHIEASQATGLISMLIMTASLASPGLADDCGSLTTPRPTQGSYASTSVVAVRGG
jgi:hypothetical protein